MGKTSARQYITASVEKGVQLWNRELNSPKAEEEGYIYIYSVIINKSKQTPIFKISVIAEMNGSFIVNSRSMLHTNGF